MKNKKVWLLILTALFTLSAATPAMSMHIMEGFLQPVWCVAWCALCVPFIALGLKKTGDVVSKNQQAVIILAMAGAFAFVLSALKIPSVTGSSSHMTGLGFAAIMFGPTVAGVLSLIVLLFQALLLAHGGLTTLGANTFSMGIVGPVVAYLVYVAFKNTKFSSKAAIFLAAALGDLSTYIVTSVQLALAHPAPEGGFAASFAKFAGIFALTQIPLAVIEGILTVVLVSVVSAYGGTIFTTLGKDVLNVAE